MILPISAHHPIRDAAFRLCDALRPTGSHLHVRSCRSKTAVWQRRRGNAGIAAQSTPIMDQFEDYRDAGLQEGFNASFTDTSLPSHCTKCRREEVQHAAMITTPHERPRPGRRRLTMHHLPLGLTQVLLFMFMVLSVLCMPTEAVEHADSHSRAVKGHYVDGRIMFDQNPVPQPTLLRRKDPASTETASTTTAAEASETSSLTSLPRAFDGGFGTNYTQPSCPTFLRSMVNNDTFISCVPFSLLLQVCHPSCRKLLPQSFPQRTNLVFPRTPCPFSTPAAPSPPSPPSSTSPAPSPSPPAQPSCPPSPSPSAPRAPAKTTTAAKTRRSAKPTPASSPTTSRTTPRV